MPQELPCPCGSQSLYGNCCEPYLLGLAVAPTAEALMRSRYTAYSQGAPEYLVKTLHPSKRRKPDKSELLESTATLQWIGLKIVKTQRGGIRDKKGMVEFVATYRGKAFLAVPGELHERSRFLKENNQWFYIDGDIL
jgi:SEC-C motif domain protein